MMHYDANYPDYTYPEEEKSPSESEIVLQAHLREFQASVKNAQRANALSDSKIHLVGNALSNLSRLAESIVREIEELKRK